MSIPQSETNPSTLSQNGSQYKCILLGRKKNPLEALILKGTGNVQQVIIYFCCFSFRSSILYEMFFMYTCYIEMFPFCTTV